MSPGCVRREFRSRCLLVTLCLRALLFAAALTVQPLHARQSPSPDNAPTTFHVYANLVQVSALVLSAERGQAAPVAGNRFWVSIDSGPYFRATHVSREGDDPISLAILVDLRGSAVNLLPRLDRAIADLAPSSLHPDDRVSIYALDCSLINSATNLPAASGPLAARLQVALQLQAMRANERQPAACPESVHLWDALFMINDTLRTSPGRRVILALTDGEDRGSRRTWNELRTYAQSTGVAIFGLTDLANIARGDRRHPPESFFTSVCELSGGIVLYTSEKDVARTLRRFVAMLRDRYTIEFPRPSNSTPGQHGLLLSIDRSPDFIRSTGVTVRLPDPALLQDPTTIPSDPSLAPVQGSRHILTPPP